MIKSKDIDTNEVNGLISLIAAIGKNRELGRAGGLLWHLPEDMQRFKEITMGHPVIMGRKTWESIPEKFRPLPGRTNIVLTREQGYVAPGAVAVTSIEEARAAAARAEGSNEVFIIGGGELYRETLALADRLYLTLVDDTTAADTFFPAYEQEFRIVSSEAGTGTPPYQFVTLERK